MGNVGKGVGKRGKRATEKYRATRYLQVFVRMKRKTKKRRYFRMRQNFEKIREEKTEVSVKWRARARKIDFAKHPLVEV